MPIYLTYEDGFFDLFPQGSTIYLAYRPNFSERLKDALLGKSEHIRLRIKKYVRPLPGRYPLLRHLHIGTGDNAILSF